MLSSSSWDKLKYNNCQFRLFLFKSAHRIFVILLCTRVCLSASLVASVNIISRDVFRYIPVQWVTLGDNLNKSRMAVPGVNSLLILCLS